ncbi:helix-turn-helix domain-containing protein [Cupriavidus necator]|uniref:helix-turn-helix domain-containing protein n=1 Tax=Cupriavidus necator TaxID=106590 RepID=UPI00148FFF7B|nr:helix-turn-helix domain-containing protein [Cupriavidus necator]NOV28022.1 helix-turn-helix domain-containing protein [Cupriavidus necator]
MARDKKAAASEGKPGGRETLYQEQYAEQAYKLCLLGATDKELADFFGVVEKTIYNWKDAQPEFLQSITRGKMMADAQVAESLFKRALGYSHPAVKIMTVNGAVVHEDYTEHYPPDTPAASLWLRNRQPEKWRDKVQQELTGKDGENLFAGIKVTFVKPE